MLLDNRTTRKGRETEEPVDIVLKRVNNAADTYPKEETH